MKYSLQINNNNNNNVVVVLLMIIMYITAVADGIHATNNLISNIIEEDSNKNNNNNAAGYVNDNDVNNFSDNNNDGGVGGDDDVVKADDDSNCHLKCQNQAKCTMHEVTKEYYCDCVKTESGGFLGNKCQISYLDCSDGDKRSWRCQNGGHCLTADDPTAPATDYKFTCHCLDWYTGRQCQDKIEKPTDSAIYDKSKNYNGKDYGTAVLSNNKTQSQQPQLSQGVIIFGLIMYCVVVGALFFMGGYFTGKRGMVSTSKEAVEESTSTSSSPDTDDNPLEENQDDNFVNVVQDINIDNEPPSEIFNKLTTIT